MNEHGIAIAASNMNGNTSDTEWNEKAIKLVKETFEERLDSITYIADSKLINLPLFKQLMEPGKRIRFISRCPSNFYNKIAGKVIKQAYQDNKWIDVGRIGSGKKACTYEVQEYLRTIEENDVRLIVVRSSAGKERYDHKLHKQQVQLEKAIYELSKKTFVCEADARKELNLIVLEKGTDLITLFNEVQDILAAQQELVQGSEKLLDSLIKGGGLQQIIDTGFELLGNPISVSDTSYELLVHTKNIEADDPVWAETISKGRIPDYFLNSIKGERLIEKVYNSSSPIMVDPPYSKYRAIMAKVVIDKKVVAHVGVVEALKPFKEGDIELVSRLCSVISTEMQRNKLFRNTGRIMYEHFITDLLDGKIKNSEIIKEKARHRLEPEREPLCIDHKY